MLGAKGMCLRKCWENRVVLWCPKIQFNENEKIMGGQSVLQSLASCPAVSRDALFPGSASSTTHRKLIVPIHTYFIFRLRPFETMFSLLFFAPSSLSAGKEFLPQCYFLKCFCLAEHCLLFSILTGVSVGVWSSLKVPGVISDFLILRQSLGRVCLSCRDPALDCVSSNKIMPSLILFLHCLKMLCFSVQCVKCGKNWHECFFYLLSLSFLPSGKGGGETEPSMR